MPYFGYARQDRKTRPRTPITARLTADLLTAAGVHRILAMDLHAGQIQGFFDIPLDNLMARPVFEKDIRETTASDGSELVIVSPDVGVSRGAKNSTRSGDVPSAVSAVVNPLRKSAKAL